jgi:pilus assembly protein CpaB
MKLNNRFLFGILSIVLAAVIAFIAIPTISRQTSGKEEIIRISKPVARGEIITKDHVVLVEGGGYNLPSNIARVTEDGVGRYATADLAVGDYILSSKVSLTPISSDIQLSNIPSGKMAISLTVKTLASGLSDKLQSGDIVRIYHFLNVAADVPELQFVKVLSVTADDGINVDNSESFQDEEEKRQTATITVLACPEQAKVITGFENDGSMHVALVTRGNEQLADELLAAQDEILLDLYPPAVGLGPQSNERFSESSAQTPVEPSQTETQQ